MYDLCVVGAGLVGCAAARHSSLVPGTKVCLIGPKEPLERSSSSQRDIFGAHYDEGRITRSSDPDPVWAALAQKSIQRYREIEQKSGIQFYHEVGCIMTGSKTGQFMKNTQTTVEKQGITVEHLTSPQSVKSKFPYLNFGLDDVAVYEYDNAGHLSPRKLIEAQVKIAVNNGCDVMDDIVCEVTRIAKDDQYVMMVKTEQGETVLAKNVLLATGAFTTFRKLLPVEVVPDMHLSPLTVAKVEIGSEDVNKIRNMPCVLYYGHGATDWWQDFPRTSDKSYGLYMIPPVLYPDGKYYLKLGHFHDSVPRRLSTAKDVKDWYCSAGQSNLVRNTAKVITSIVKGVKMRSFHGDYCVIQETPTNRPYIDMLHSQLGLAIGGNGYAAKSSDEIGRLAALMILGKPWDTDIARSVFNLKLKPSKTINSHL